MISCFNLLVALFLPSLLEWWQRWSVVAEPVKLLGPGEYAKALSAIAGILILGLGGVFLIGFSGSWMRRWIFKVPQRSLGNASSGSHIGMVDWAKPSDQPEQDVCDEKDSKIHR